MMQTEFTKINKIKYLTICWWVGCLFSDIWGHESSASFLQQTPKHPRGCHAINFPVLHAQPALCSLVPTLHSLLYKPRELNPFTNKFTMDSKNLSLLFKIEDGKGNSVEATQENIYAVLEESNLRMTSFGKDLDWKGRLWELQKCQAGPGTR